MVPLLTSPTLLQNSTVVVVAKRISKSTLFTNGHQMVSVLTSPTLLQNSTFVVVV